MYIVIYYHRLTDSESIFVYNNIIISLNSNLAPSIAVTNLYLTYYTAERYPLTHLLFFIESRKKYDITNIGYYTEQYKSGTENY